MTANQKAFLAAFAKVGNVQAAADAAGIDRSTHYRWMKRNSRYRQRFEFAREAAADALEAVARRRAIEGSDQLLMFLLKGLRPEVYRERTEHHFGNVPGEFTFTIGGGAPE